MRTFLVLLFIILITNACAMDDSKENNYKLEGEGIENTLKKWASAIKDSDLEGMALLATEDATFWSHGAPELKGREALKQAFKPFFENYSLEQDFELEELIISEDYAFMRGLEINTLTTSDGEESVQHQRAFSILKKGEDGIWRFHRGMTNLPPSEINEE